MRVTFVLANGFGLAGGERNIAQWADGLQQRGHEVLLISPPPRPPTLRERVRAWRRGTRPAGGPRASHFDRVAVRRVLLDRYRPVVNSDVPDADVVIATWWETAEWVAALAPCKGVHVHLIQHHEVFDYLPAARVAASYKLPLRKIVIAPWLERVMRETYGDPDVILITQGIDRTLFDAPPRGKQRVPTVGLMYSPLAWKGCDVSLHAFALAKQQIPDLQLVAFGSEPPAKGLPLPPGARFTLRPPQATIRDMYARCDAWLFGSRSEGFALPPLEAMACRTPVIGTPAGGEAQVIQAGGFLVPPEDSRAMAEAICHIAAASDAEWRVLSGTAYKTVAPYTRERSTDELEAALQSAVDRVRGEMGRG